MYFLRLLVITFFTLCIPISHAEDDDPFLGVYDLLDRPQKILAADKVEVAELFLYTCPHCFHFEPLFKAWKQKRTEPEVAVMQVPAVFNDNNIVLAKAFYVADALKVLDKLHQVVFEAVQEKHQKITNEAELQAIFVAQGIDAKAFSEAYNSFGVDSKVRQAKMLTQAYGITSVPNVVVNGKYRLSPGKAETIDQLLKAVDHLVDKEIKISKSASPK